MRRVLSAALSSASEFRVETVGIDDVGRRDQSARGLLLYGCRSDCAAHRRFVVTVRSCCDMRIGADWPCRSRRQGPWREVRTSGRGFRRRSPAQAPRHFHAMDETTGNDGYLAGFQTDDSRFSEEAQAALLGHHRQFRIGRMEIVLHHGCVPSSLRALPTAGCDSTRSVCCGDPVR